MTAKQEKEKRNNDCYKGLKCKDIDCNNCIFKHKRGKK